MTRRYTGGFLSTKEQATDANAANGVYTLQEANALTASGNFPTGRWTPQRSLRFRAASTSLTKTYGAGSNSEKYTLSFWVKRGKLGTSQSLLDADSGTAWYSSFLQFTSSDTLRFWTYYGAIGTRYGWTTTQVFRDTSAWYHFVIAVDTSISGQQSRRLWVNGAEVTSFTAEASGYNSTGMNTYAFANGVSMAMFSSLDGYTAENNMVWGQTLSPTSFGETDAATGTWVPKRYTGTYGTNGFYLPFSDVSSVSSRSIGRNFAPQANYLQYSEQLSNTSFWRAGNGSVTANTAVAPDTTTTAETFTDNSTNGAHRIENINYDASVPDGFPFIAGKRYTVSYYVKYISQRYVGLVVGGLTGVGLQWYQRSIAFDLVNGTISRDANNGSQGSIEAVGNDWYRISLSFTPATTDVDYPHFCHSPDGTMDTTGFVGTGKQTYVWGAQLNEGSLQPYSATTSVVPNDWTPTNISLTAGTTYDSMVDVPGLPAVTNQTDIGGVQRGNYCTLNPLNRSSQIASNIAQANLYVVNGTSWPGITGTISVSSGKWYYECYVTGHTTNSSGIIGWCKSDMTVNGDISDFSSQQGGFYIRNDVGGFKQRALNFSTSIDLISGGFYTNSVIQIAVDFDSGKMWIGKDGTWITGNPSDGSNPAFSFLNTGSYTPFIGPARSDIGQQTYTCNFGQRTFSYTPPTGFKSINTTNLPNPVIKRSSDHFDVKTYTGTGTALSIGTTQKQSSAVQIPYSLRSTIGDAGATTHLTRIPSITGNRRTWTFSAWIKRTKIGIYQAIFHNNGTTGSNYEGFRFMDSDKLQCYLNGGNSGSISSAATFKDTNRWYHIMYVFDSTHAAPAERQRVYVDGVRQVMSGTVATQNYDSFYNYPTIQAIGSQYVSDQSHGMALDGHFAEVNMVDGQALSPSSFGAFDAYNNWVPQRYTGTYGTNGFYLPFNTPSARTQSYAGKFETSSVQYLKTPATSASNVLEFGSNNFTIEFWWCPRVVERQALYHGSFGTDWSVGIDFNGANSNNVIGIWASSTGTGWNLLNADPGGNAIGSIPLRMNEWNHVAFVRNGSTWQSYINGQLDKNLTGISGSIAARANSAKAVGSWWNPASMGTAGGQISNFRILNGTALYTASFKPPVGPLTAIANTALLTLQDSTLVDNSANALSLTNVASVTFQPADPNTVNIGIGQDASGSGNHLQAHQFGIQHTTLALNYATPGTYSWTAPAGVTSVKALVVAGGGSGGGYCGGGGGAGGMIYNSSYTVVPGTSYTVTVGAGGNGATWANGGNSVFATLTAVGGGHGSIGGGGTTSGVAGTGGSGGGGGSSSGLTTGGTGTAGQGFRGGDSGGPAGNYSSGGGGGAGGPGQSTTTAMPFGGNGGIGLACDITGIPTYYAGGGGGGVANNAGGGGWANRGRGGLGGGGDAGTHDASGAVLYIGKHGTNGLGGGGGGSNRNYGDTLGLNGGHGVVILSYSGAASYTGPGANSSEWQDNMLIESPASYTDSSGTHSNYCTMNAATASSYVTVSKGGTLVYGNTSSNSGTAIGTMGVTKGKWYWETTVNTVGGISYAGIGINLPANNAETWGVVGGATAGALIRQSSAAFGGYGALTGTSVAFTTGDVIGVALDADNGALYYHKNGTWMNSGVPTSGSSKTGAANGWVPGSITAYPAGGGYNNSLNFFNFGQRPFAYTPPSGFKELNNKNIQDAGMTNLPDTFGNFVNTPDLIWTKNRTTSADHGVYDTVRGPENDLRPNTAVGATTYAGYGVQGFKPNGFDVAGNGTVSNSVNDNFVSWAWNRGKTPGFDIVAYSGTGAARTVKHSLGVPPKMMIVKQVSSGSNSWFVYHAGVGAGSWMALNLTNAAASDSTVWNNTAPTSTEFSLGTNTAGNGSAVPYIAYLWAEVPGFSNFGTYKGNGSADGPFVNCGFRPRWVYIKRTDAVASSIIIDTERSPTNPMLKWVNTDQAAGDTTGSGDFIDYHSNGFKLRYSGANNTNGGTYIYAAFAEAPFKYANAR